MRTLYNRFALIPVKCESCHNIVWLEPYRKVEIYKPISLCVPSFRRENWCKICTKRHFEKDVDNEN